MDILQDRVRFLDLCTERIKEATAKELEDRWLHVSGNQETSLIKFIKEIIAHKTVRTSLNFAKDEMDEKDKEKEGKKAEPGPVSEAIKGVIWHVPHRVKPPSIPDIGVLSELKHINKLTFNFETLYRDTGLRNRTMTAEERKMYDAYYCIEDPIGRAIIKTWKLGILCELTEEYYVPYFWWTKRLFEHDLYVIRIPKPLPGILLPKPGSKSTTQANPLEDFTFKDIATLLDKVREDEKPDFNFPEAILANQNGRTNVMELWIAFALEGVDHFLDFTVAVRGHILAEFERNLKYVRTHRHQIPQIPELSERDKKLASILSESYQRRTLEELDVKNQLDGLVSRDTKEELEAAQRC